MRCVHCHRRIRWWDRVGWRVQADGELLYWHAMRCEMAHTWTPIDETPQARDFAQPGVYVCDCGQRWSMVTQP